MKARFLYKLTLLITLIFVIACSNNPDNQNFSNTNDKSDSANNELPESIDLVIGRFSFYTGHIISVKKNGEYNYFFGSQHDIDKETLSKITPPEFFNVKLFKQNEYYEQKSGKINPKKIKEIIRLIEILKNEKVRHIKNDLVIAHETYYVLYLDKKLIAFGKDSLKEKFPKSFQEIIRLLENEVKLHNI